MNREDPDPIQRNLVLSRHNCNLVFDPPYYTGKQQLLFEPRQNAATDQARVQMIVICSEKKNFA